MLFSPPREVGRVGSGSGVPAAVTQHDLHNEVGDGIGRLFCVKLCEHVTRVVRRAAAQFPSHEPEQSTPTKLLHGITDNQLLVYKAMNGLAPSYIQDLCVPVTAISTRAALRSAARGDLVLPRTRRRLGNRAFCVAGPAAWNSLPSDIRTASTLSTFNKKLS